MSEPTAMTPVEELTFEEASRELSQIVGMLEKNECTLEESVRLYERGSKLSQACEKMLDAAEQRVQQLETPKSGT